MVESELSYFIAGNIVGLALVYYVFYFTKNIERKFNRRPELIEALEECNIPVPKYNRDLERLLNQRSQR